MQKDDWQVLKGGKAFVLKYDTFPGNIMKAKAKENTKLHTNQTLSLTVWSTYKFSKTYNFIFLYKYKTNKTSFNALFLADHLS